MRPQGMSLGMRGNEVACPKGQNMGKLRTVPVPKGRDR